MRFLAIIFFFAIACSADKTAGRVIIPRMEMTKILWDMILVDEFAADFIHRDTLKDVEKERKKLYLQVYSLHKISREQFSSSFKHYAGRPSEMKIIFDSLSARGTRERKYVYLPKDSLPR